MHKILELIKEFSKIAEYKINTQTSVAIVYTNNEKQKLKKQFYLPYNSIYHCIKKNKIP